MKVLYLAHVGDINLSSVCSVPNLIHLDIVDNVWRALVWHWALVKPESGTTKIIRKHGATSLLM